MKDDESRQLMVKRVKAAYEKWPHFISLPEVKREAGLLEAEMPGLEPHYYVSALHNIGANGEVLGRYGNFVIGTFVNIGTTALQEAVKPTAGRRMKAEAGK